jgi:hypothetical protein
MEKSNKIKRTENAGNKSANKESKKVHVFWKGIAITFITIFCVILVFGVIRWQHFRPHQDAAQQQQIDMAKEAVSADLSSAGYNISDYNVQVASTVRGFEAGMKDESIIQISLFGESKIHQYLVDADSGKMIMHSETTFYDGMKNISMGSPKSRGFFQNMIPGFRNMMPGSQEKGMWDAGMQDAKMPARGYHPCPSEQLREMDNNKNDSQNSGCSELE